MIAFAGTLQRKNSIFFAAEGQPGVPPQVNMSAAPSRMSPQKGPQKFFIALFFILILGMLATINFIDFHQKSEISNSPLYSPAPTTVGANDALKKKVNEARDRALAHPYMKVDDPPGNAILELSNAYQITYEANEDKFTINIYSPDLEKTRQVAEDYLLKHLLKTNDKKVACGVKVLIAASPKADKSGNWGPFTELSFCDGERESFHFIQKAYAACVDVWKNDPDCSCTAMTPFFGNYSWVARLIAARETACNPSAVGDNGMGGGLMALERPYVCGATYKCGSRSVTTSSNASICASQILNATTAKIIACSSAYSNGGKKWTAWATCPGNNYANDCTTTDVCNPPADNGSHPSSCSAAATPTPTPIPTFTISGNVKLDGSRNLSGVTIRLSNGRTTTTNSSGNYNFTGVINGSYTVSIVVPACYTATTATSRSVRGAPNVGGVDFGVTDYTISGNVFLDTNRNGVKNGGEGNYSGATISLGGSVTRTNGSGNYSFANVCNGTHTVTITVPANFVNTTPTSRSVSVGPNGTADFGITRIYTISGNVFNDINKNRIKNGGEPNYLGGIAITASSGTVNTNSAAGTFTVSRLFAGTYVVSYVSSLPRGYILIYPKNGPPPSFSVKVGPGCTVDGTSGAQCTGGNSSVNDNVTNLNFAISSSVPWMQTYDMDIRLDNGITNWVPPTSRCSVYATNNNSSATNPGIIFSGDGTTDYGLGQSSATGWVVGGTQYPEVYTPSVGSTLKTSYATLLARSTQADIAPVNMTTISGCSNLANCTLPAGLPNGVYKANGSVTLNAHTFSANKNYIFLINGTLTIKGSIQVPNGATAIFSAAKDIIIDRSVGTATYACPASGVGQVQGFFSADRNFVIDGYNDCVNNPDRMLNIAGTIIFNAAIQGGTFVNNRDLCGNDQNYPSFTVSPRLDFLLNAPTFLMQQSTQSIEAAP